MRISGLAIQYAKTCPRELWLYLHNINLNFEDQNILIGRKIHQDSFSRKKKEILLDTIKIDVIDFTPSDSDDELNFDGPIILEIKKSRKLVEPAKYQLYFYLWQLEKIGIRTKGMLVYPSEKRREIVELTDQIRNELTQLVQKIEHISNLPTPPPATKKPYCKGCSYFEFCFIE